MHTPYSHNQTLGIGYYEYSAVRVIGKPLPVLNVGSACQYQSYELVETAGAGISGIYTGSALI